MPNIDEQIGRGNPEVERILTEMDALNTTLRAVFTNLEGFPDALRLVRQSYGTRGKPETLDDFVVLVAMARILGARAPTSPPVLLEEPEGEARVTETIALAWVDWAAGRASEGARRLRELSPATPNESIHMLALRNWAAAVEALTANADHEARRCFQRAYEIGASFGTDSHPVVLWTMAASFFPKPTAT